MMESFYDTLTLEHQASWAADENWKAGFKVPTWGGNHNLPVNMLEMSSSLFPLKHKHFHIYSVCEPPKTPINPTPVHNSTLCPCTKIETKRHTV